MALGRQKPSFALEEGHLLTQQLRLFFGVIPFGSSTVDESPVTMLRCKRAVITWDSGLAVQVDGEIYAEAARRLEIEILP